MVSNIYASEVMSHPVVTLKSVENVGHIVELLKLTTYNGFPVVDPPLTDQVKINATVFMSKVFTLSTFFQNEVTTYGRIRGLILRSQLIVILQKKIFNETCDSWDHNTASIFRDQYPRYPSIEVSTKIYLYELFVTNFFPASDDKRRRITISHRFKTVYESFTIYRTPCKTLFLIIIII